MEKRWILRKADEGVVSRLSDELKISPLLARILTHRGFAEPEAATNFLSCSLRSGLPSPFLMADMDSAVGRLVRALQAGELIGVWGDYDVDGTTGTAALISFLRDVGGAAVFYIPHRIEEGYGLNREGIEQLVSQGVKVIVSVDCGISNYQEVEFSQNLGIDVIVVDHHEPPEILPPAVAVLNPHRADCSFPDDGLSGAGLAFYLIIGLRAKLREIGWFNYTETPDIRRYLDIVTLGTVADMVPLLGVNRVLTRRGLMEISNSSRAGILALRKVAGMPEGDVAVGRIAFQLGSRINAAGRMDAAIKVVEMLTTQSFEAAYQIAQELDAHNRARRETEARVLEDALAQLEAEVGGERSEVRGQKSEVGIASPERYSIVLGADGWHPGVLGIVASRIVERFHRPTVVVGFDQAVGKGSARSIRGFHLVEGLRRCADLLEKYGGHEFAGGLSIRRENFMRFSERFEEAARDCLTPEELVSFLEVDAEVDLSQVDLSVARQLDVLAPFGISNPEPLLMVHGVEVSDRKDFDRVTRFRLHQAGRSLGAVAFGPAKEVPGRTGEEIDIVFRLRANQWNGTASAELRIVDARLSSGRPGLSAV
jgi:single-stranded-DNA-specific exonuclease